MKRGEWAYIQPIWNDADDAGVEAHREAAIAIHRFNAEREGVTLTSATRAELLTSMLPDLDYPFTRAWRVVADAEAPDDCPAWGVEVIDRD